MHIKFLAATGLVLVVATFLVLLVPAAIVVRAPVETTQAMADNGLICVGRCDGLTVYPMGLHVIRLASNSSSVLAHEYGHFIWDTRLNQSEKANWTVKYEHAKMVTYPSSYYGLTNVCEFYAECYAQAHGSEARFNNVSCPAVFI